MRDSDVQSNSPAETQKADTFKNASTSADQYLSTLSAQIRCKKARPFVEEEIRGHIEDQASFYMETGMDKDIALEKAVKDMGDPVTAGVELDRVHKPRMQWTLLLVAIALSLIGMIMQIIIFATCGDTNAPDFAEISGTFIFRSVCYTLLGILIMLGVCLLDYTFLGKYPLPLWLVLCFGSLLLFLCADRGYPVWISYNAQYRMEYYYRTLMIPGLAALIFSLRGNGWKGYLKSIFFFALGFWFFGFGMGPFSSSVEYLTSGLIILSVAIYRGWFLNGGTDPLEESGRTSGINKILQFLILWAPFVLFPVLLFLMAWFPRFNFLLRDYQADRIRSFISLAPGSEKTYNYTISKTQEALSGSSLFGGNQIPAETLPSIQNDYIVTCLFTYFGIALASILLLLVFLFLVKAFRISFRQKNQLGSIVSIGCVTSLTIKCAIYVMVNFGVAIPFAQMSMPFLSYGLGNTVVNSVLVGFLLSIFRNTDIVSEKHIVGKYAFRSPVVRRN